MPEVLNTTALFAAEDSPWPRDDDQPTAACFGKDPEAWFPATQAAYEYAVSVCVACDLRDLCRTVAEARGEWGVWGGVLFAKGKPLAGLPVPGRPAKKDPAAA